MSYVVTAPLVLALDKEGKTHHVYEGGVIDWLSDEQATHFLDAGLAKEVDGGESDADDGKPNKSALKPELVEWIAENVAKEDGSDYTTEELNELKVPELRAIVDSVE